jgi:hypothetical protein
MSKTIDIEYCGETGCGGSATKLKTALKSAFPEAEINSRPANGKTDRIEVAWLDGNGQKITVWSKSKIDTEGGHQTIIGNLRSAQ